MSYEVLGGLPSLVHPVIVNASQGFDSNLPGLFLPPFPEIDLRNWAGFTLSHLHWIGIRASREDLSSDEAGRQLELFMHHELYHRDLAHTPFSLLRKDKMHKLYDRILMAIEEEQGSIEVPLRPDLGRNELEKQWAIVVRLKKGSELVEEVFAVRSSLLDARRLRLISPTTRLDLISASRRDYGKVMPEFPVIYDTFDLVAGKIGEIAATAMVYNVLRTLNPTVALLDVMSALCKIALPLRDPVNDFLWKPSPEETAAIASYSLEEADCFFSTLINALDKDGSRYKIKIASEAVAAIKNQWDSAIQDIPDIQDPQYSVAKMSYSSSPWTFLYSQYDYFIHHFGGVIGALEVVYGDHNIILEAIRQQLTTGRGLLCPFWMCGDTCCGSENREILEKVWSCTYRNSNCELWRRWGCLEQ